MKKYIIRTTIIGITLGMFFSACQNFDSTGPDPDGNFTRNNLNKGRQSLELDAALVVSDYPMSVSFDVAFHKKHKQYMNDGATLQNGSIISLPYASLTPPDGYRYGETVTIDFTADTLNNEMIFSFGPSGCTFDPPLKVVMNYKDLAAESDAKLYYISESGTYIEQQPAESDLFGNWMTIYVNHFSRYAVAYGR